MASGFGRTTATTHRGTEVIEINMTVSDLQRLFDYSYWANGKVLDVVARLDTEQFTRDVAGSYGSIRNTLVHALSAEWGWLDRCGGPPRGPALKAEDYPTLESVRERWHVVESQLRAFLSTLHDLDLARTVEFKIAGNTRVMQIGDLLQHAVVHGVHHRGQVALLLRALGQAPGNVDLLLYDIERQAHAG